MTTAATLNKIWVRGMGEGLHDEGVLDTIAYPGTIIEMAADGKYDPMTSTYAEYLKGGPIKVALEDTLQGRMPTDAYAVGDIVFFGVPKRGDRMCLLVKSGENIAVQDKLVAEITSGLLVEAAGTEARYIAKALESSGGALAANTLLLCEIC